MRLLAWNIGAGGGARLPRIVEELSAFDAEVMALTAYRSKPGAMLRAALAELGWPYVETTDPAGNDSGIAVFSRTPMLRRPPCAEPNRWLDVDLPEYGFGIGVLRIMAAGQSEKDAAGQAKTRFWETVLREAEARIREPFLLAGDWSTGIHGLDESGRTFVCARHFAKLSEIGWIDLWRRHNPGATEWTWRSQRNGFRVNHAFATPGLAARVTDCRYSHAQREAGISNHSIVVLETAI